jgi:tetratricopeptide (TPR) repeat protein
VLKLAQLKGEARCAEKVRDDYGGVMERLCDLVRCSITVGNEEDLVATLVAIKGEYSVVRLKNRFANPMFTGIMDCLLNVEVEVELPYGLKIKRIKHICEIQLHLAPILALKKECHKWYEIFREYFVGATESYRKLMDKCDRLGEDLKSGDHPRVDVEAAIKGIVAGDDEGKLHALHSLMERDVLADYELCLRAMQRRFVVIRDKPDGSTVTDEQVTLAREIANTLLAFGDGSEEGAPGFGCMEKAMPWFEWALQCYESLGDEDKALSVIESLGVAHSKLGNHEQSLVYLQKSLTAKEKKFGKGHENTLVAANNLGMHYKGDGKHEKALDIYLGAMGGFEEYYGKEHPTTLKVMTNVGIVYQAMSDYERAIEWYEKTLKVRNAVLGKKHEDTLACVFSIATSYRDWGRKSQAIPYLERMRDSWPDGGDLFSKMIRQCQED